MSMDELWEEWNEYQRASAESNYTKPLLVIGQQVKKGIEDLISRTSADEILVQSEIYDHQSRIKSYEVLSELFRLQKPSKQKIQS